MLTALWLNPSLYRSVRNSDTVFTDVQKWLIFRLLQNASHLSRKVADCFWVDPCNEPQMMSAACQWMPCAPTACLKKLLQSAAAVREEGVLHLSVPPGEPSFPRLGRTVSWSGAATVVGTMQPWTTRVRLATPLPAPPQLVKELLNQTEGWKDKIPVCPRYCKSIHWKGLKIWTLRHKWLQLIVQTRCKEISFWFTKYINQFVEK